MGGVPQFFDMTRAFALRSSVWSSGVVLGIFVLLLWRPGFVQAQSYVGTGRSVLDGDTVELLRETGQIVRIELYGIDAPELGQPYGVEAARALRQAVVQERVRAAAEGRDDDGRPLFVLRVGDRVLNEQLVRDGLAWWDRRRAAHDDRLRRLEQRARRAERGLWAQSDPVPPWKWRAGKGGS